MRLATRLAFNTYLSTIAQLNGVPDATQQFAVDPTIEQKLETKMQESVDFLGRINVILVDEKEGATVGIGVGGPIAGRTNTDAADRQTTDPHNLSERKYRCEETDSDTHIKWATLDTWAKFPDFQTRVRDAIIRRQGLDRIMIGFMGTHVAPNTNKTNFPLLQDVNVGWLQSMRLEAPARVMGSRQVAGDTPAERTEAVQIYVDPSVAEEDGYKNLDALVYDATELLDPWHQEDTELVAIVGRKLLHDKYFPLLNNEERPTEQLAGQVIMSQKRIGGLPAVRVPHFPDNAILITRLDNLSIYVQEGSRRRRIEDNAKRKRIENYESANEDYVVEDYGCAVLIENIVLGPKPAEDPEEGGA